MSQPKKRLPIRELGSDVRQPGARPSRSADSAGPTGGAVGRARGRVAADHSWGSGGGGSPAGGGPGGRTARRQLSSGGQGGRVTGFS